LTEFSAHLPILAKMRDAAADFLAAMYNNEQPYALVLLGPSGTGKTTLAKLINRFFQTYMRHKVDTAISPLKPSRGYAERWLCAGGFINWGTALREMLDTREWERMGAYRGDFFLVLDDIMSEHEKQRELSASKLYDILTERHDRRWLVVTANYSLNDIETKLEPRIASRLIRDRNVRIEIPADTPDYATLKLSKIEKPTK
jgi:chromosomal replication initiation ATPase DnaA